ncbi:MAG: hypothetical protein KA941_03565 [Flavobacteriales bacterium]|nr:hypothetical protein [Flavobacteriales bacterium]
MNRADLNRLRSERAEVMRMLGNIPKERVIDRGSLEYRLEVLDENIAQAGDIPAPARTVITFRGKPVVGSHGIFYDFGTKAIGHFADAVAKLAVPPEDEMGARGRIPGKAQNRLLITNAAVGSFGFELEEEPSNELHTEEPSSTAQAMKQVSEILEAARSSDDDLAKSIADAQPRAVTSVREFLDLLVKNDAVAAVAYGDHVVRFSHVAEVRDSYARLEPKNVHEDTKLFKGKFLGLLPHRRTFEFQLEGHEDPIVGKIPKGLAGIETINAHLNDLVQAKLKETRVGEGKPSFALVEVPQWL